MKALVLRSFGDVSGFELRDIPDPALPDGHLLVRVVATGVNPLDCKLRRRGGDMAPPLPAVLGADFSGVVMAVAGDVHRFVTGEEVYGCGGGLRGLPGGALAEYLAVDANLAARKPRRLSHREAAALPLVAITALEGLDRAGVGAGDRVLVRGGTGGVGHVVVQLAKARGALDADRISEPQLPLYAAFGDCAMATVSFARVVLDEPGFSGISAQPERLAKVPAVSAATNKSYAQAGLTTWEAVINHWQRSIGELASEIEHGAAAVVLNDANDLRYCDVLPLLRLAERQRLWQESCAPAR